MTRQDIIAKLYEDEINRLQKIPNGIFSKPKKGYEAEFKKCKERLACIGQMMSELPMDYIEKDKDTGFVIQTFIGTLEGQPDLLYSDNKYYYVNMVIMDIEAENRYKDKRLLRLSYNVWRNWFFYLKYDDEKQLRQSKNLCTYIRAKVINDEVVELKWHNPNRPVCVY